MAMLPAYESHVASRGGRQINQVPFVHSFIDSTRTPPEGRSLIAYFGCHSLRMPWRYSGKVYFVVMRNFVPVQPWLTFDLKGATANRRALTTRALHQIHAQA